MKADLPKEVVKLLRRRPDLDEYGAIRQSWVDHSAAEAARDIPGLTATLTDDCEYVVANSGARWRGKGGVAEFYTQLSPRSRTWTSTCSTSSSARRAYTRKPT